jgi:hypothetical protein
MALESLECPMGPTQEAAEAMAPEGDRPGGLSYVPQFTMQAEGGALGRTALIIGLVGVAIGLIVLVILSMH